VVVGRRALLGPVGAAGDLVDRAAGDAVDAVLVGDVEDAVLVDVDVVDPAQAGSAPLQPPDPATWWSMPSGVRL
jgi:hypothetical protein